MTKYNILKSFPYSKDGVNKLSAEKGETLKMPENLVAGLTAAGFIEPVGKKDKPPKKLKKSKKKDKGAAPENKMNDPVAENKADQDAAIKQARADYLEVLGKKAFPGWAIDVLLQKIADHKAENES